LPAAGDETGIAADLPAWNALLVAFDLIRSADAGERSIDAGAVGTSLLARVAAGLFVGDALAIAIVESGVAANLGGRLASLAPLAPELTAGAAIPDAHTVSQ
jgi:hypothetical protein